MRKSNTGEVISDVTEGKQESFKDRAAGGGGRSKPGSGTTVGVLSFWGNMNAGATLP